MYTYINTGQGFLRGVHLNNSRWNFMAGGIERWPTLAVRHALCCKSVDGHRDIYCLAQLGQNLVEHVIMIPSMFVILHWLVGPPISCDVSSPSRSW